MDVRRIVVRFQEDVIGLDLLQNFQTGFGPTQRPIQKETLEIAPGVKQVGCEADHLPPLRADMKNERSFVCLQGAQRKLYVGTVNFIVTYLLHGAEPFFRG
jgi:hypothetical protein